MALIRQPVVAIVGHIDHGKTSLLDYIRKSAVASREAGGITQRVSAYEITHQSADGPKPITFIDTPGHEAFGGMRRRSARAADIAILIVAADDGVKPQTIEALKAVQDAQIPMIVAFTKIDKNTANLDRARESVLREGVYLEGLGGDVPQVALSSVTGEGVSELLDLIVLVSDINSIDSDDSAPARAVVIESSRDARTGVAATVIVREGTIATGGFAVSGTALAPLRILEDVAGARATEIRCGRPARIVGFSEEPAVGSIVTVYATKKEAEAAVAEARRGSTSPAASARATSEEKPVLRVVIKADTLGSVEALQYEIGKLLQDAAEILVVASGVGAINENDVKLLIGFSPAALVGFNVKVEPSAKDLAERQHIMLETKDIIYELAEWLGVQLQAITPDTAEAEVTGTIKILKHFSTTGNKHVVGGRVESGVLKLNDFVRVNRRGIEVGKGRITNLQLQKSNVQSVTEGMECGLMVETKADVVGGDLLEAGREPHHG